MKKKINSKRIGAIMLAFAMASAACTPAIASFTQAQPVANKKAKSKAKVKKSKTKKKKSYRAKAGIVNLKAITLTKGKSKTISVKSKSKVTWKTSNKSVVSVKSISKSKVKITAKKEGSANVTGKAKSAKWNVKVKVKGNKKPTPKPSGTSNFYFKIDKAPNTIKFLWPGIANTDSANYSSLISDSQKEGADVNEISAIVDDNSKVNCFSSDQSILKVVKPDLSEFVKSAITYKLIPYKAGTVTLTMTYPGGSYKKKVTVKPSAVYEKIKNFIPAVKNSGLDDAHKAYLIAAWLYKNTTYGYSDNDGVYGLLVEGKGVCGNYATAYEWLTSLVGLDCHIVTGNIYQDHAWNQIKLNGEWYNIDATGSSQDEKKKNFSDHSFAFFSDAKSKEPGRYELYNGKLNNHVPATSTKYDDDDSNTQLKYWASFEQTDQFKQLISL